MDKTTYRGRTPFAVTETESIDNCWQAHIFVVRHLNPGFRVLVETVGRQRITIQIPDWRHTGRAMSLLRLHGLSF